LIHVAKFLSRFSTLFYFSPTFSIHDHFYLFSDRVSGQGNAIGRVRPLVCFNSVF